MTQNDTPQDVKQAAQASPERIQEYEAWLRDQLNRAATRLHEKNLIGSKTRGECAWNIPFRYLIGKVWETEHETNAYWIVGGLFPHDQIEAALAATPREAARHFGMKWQLKGEQLTAMPEDALKALPEAAREIDWKEFGRVLSGQGELMMTVAARDDVWPAETTPQTSDESP